MLLNQKKQNFFDFFQSFSYKEKIKFPWLGFHFIFLESKKQKSAWKDFITSFGEITSKGEKEIKNFIKISKKKLNLEKFTINIIARYCCEWNFNDMINIYEDFLLEEDPWTPIVLYWQLLLYLSSRIVPQNINEGLISNSYGMIFLNITNVSFSFNILLDSLNKNIESISNWLIDNTSKPNFLKDIANNLKKFFEIVRNLLSPSQSFTQLNLPEFDMFQKALQIPGLLENGTGESLCLDMIVKQSSIYYALVNQLNINMILPPYQQPPVFTENNKSVISSIAPKLIEERISPGPPDFYIPPPQSNLFSSQSDKFFVRLDPLVSQAKQFYQVINRWEEVIQRKLKLIENLYSLQTITRPESFKCQGRCPPVEISSYKLSLQLKNSLNEEKLDSESKKLLLFSTIEKAEEIISNEFCNATVELKTTLDSLIYQIREYFNENDSYDALRMQKIGEAVFIQLLSVLDDNTANFKPTKIILLERLKDLEFVLYKSRDLLHVYQTLLGNPIRGKLCREMFYPMLNLDYFIPLYELVLSKTGEFDNETIDYLCSCLNEKQWLNSLSLSPYSSKDEPSYQECKRIISIVLKNPLKQEDGFLSIVSFMFPLFYLDCLNELLNQLENRKVLPETVNQFVSYLEQNTSNLSVDIIFTSSNLLYSSLWKMRQSDSLYNLHYSAFASIFVRLNSLLSIAPLYSNSAKFEMSQYFQHLDNLYVPWIGNLDDNTKESSFAWHISDTHKNLALPFLESFVESITNSQLIGMEIEMLHYFWNFFIKYLSNDKIAFHWSVYCDLFLSNEKLKWKQFLEWHSFADQLTKQALKFEFRVPPPTLYFFNTIGYHKENTVSLNDPDEWQIYYIPYLIFFLCQPLPIQYVHSKYIKDYIKLISWETSGKSTIDNYKQYLSCDIINELFANLFIVPNSNQNSNQPPGQRNPIISMNIMEETPITCLEEQLFFCLNYLRQPASPKNYLGLTENIETFQIFYEYFNNYLFFIRKLMANVNKFRTQGCGDILLLMINQLVGTLGSLSGQFIEFVGDSPTLACVRSIFQTFNYPSWSSVIQSIISLLLKGVTNFCTFILGACTIDLVTQPALSMYCEIILDRYFSSMNGWGTITDHFNMSDKFNHVSFQEQCAFNGFCLTIHCYFFSLHKRHFRNKPDSIRIITDFWSVCKKTITLPSFEDKLILLYFLIVEQIYVHISYFKSLDNPIRGILVELMKRLEKLSNSKGIEAKGGGMNPLTEDIKLIIKILLTFLQVQVQSNNGNIIQRLSPNQTRSIIGSLESLARKKEYARFGQIIIEFCKFIASCEGTGLSKILELRDRIFHNIFLHIKRHYWVSTRFQPPE